MVPWCASAKWCSCCLVCRSNTLIDLSSDPETMNLLSLDTATDSLLPLWKRMSGGVEERKERMMVPWCASAKWCSCCLVCRSNTLMDLSFRPRNDEPVVARHRNWVVLRLWKRMSGGVEERKERMMVPWCASAKWCSCCLVCRSNTLMELSLDPETMNLLSLDTATDSLQPLWKRMSGGVEERKERMMVLVCASAKWCSCCLVCRSNTLMDLSSDPETMNLLSLDTATEQYCSLWKRMSGGVEERKERMMVLVCASAKWCSCCLVCRSNTLMDLSSDPETMNLLSLDTATDHTSRVYERGWVAG